MGAIQLSWQDWGEHTRLWMAGVKPLRQARVFIKCLLGTQLYTTHRGGLQRPQKITAVLRLKVNQNEVECGVRAGGPLQLPAPLESQGQRVDSAWSWAGP